MLALEKVLKQLPKSDLADAKTIDYNNDTSLKDVTSNKGSIIAAKKISKKYEKIRRKKKKKTWNRQTRWLKNQNYLVIQPQIKTREQQLKKLATNINKIRKKSKKDVRFIKQEPVHPRYRMKRKVKLEPHDGVTFIKQVPMHPRDRMKRKRKIKLESYDQLAKKIKYQMLILLNKFPFIREKGLNDQPKQIRFTSNVPEIRPKRSRVHNKNQTE